ncbi:MAG: tryptophan-rich sensory protein [Flavobacteriales bacterium]|nr:tryptophan-rich sensory protein [Flavobacteriales bacterium]MBP7154525.1 tryptophan-rich sensory protein [Flavobacteriales bacterium]
MKKFYAVLNTLVVVFVIFWNYWSNTGAINGRTVGELSDKFANLFTPAGYAFAIWGLIFLGLLVLVGNQFRLAFRGGVHDETIEQIGPWLSIANVGNAAWLWFWLHEQTGLSVLVMLVILFSLIQVVLRLNMERWDAPLSVIAFVWWPICLYSGWIAVATIANIAAWLTSIQWSMGLTEVQWTVVMISVAGVLNLIMIFTRNMREFALVGVWAIAAIAARHWGEIATLQWTSVAWAAILLASIMYHAYKNRHAGPFRDRNTT